MLYNIWLASALFTTVLCGPSISLPQRGAATPAEMEIISDYFSLLASKVASGKQLKDAPTCNLANAVMPIASPTPLPAPAAGLILKHVAIGRGTQNYTCGTNATAAPTAIGAVATLYNASCIASTYPDLLSSLPNVALQFDVPSFNNDTLAPSSLLVSGHHFFTNNTTPFFDLNTAQMTLGTAPCSKNASEPAPAGSPLGQGNQGVGSVAWLRLLTRDGATGNLQEVYRVNTAGGAPPATCAGLAPTFEIQYAAEYWFFESS